MLKILKTDSSLLNILEEILEEIVGFLKRFVTVFKSIIISVNELYIQF